jgi:hypothetical protein
MVKKLLLASIITACCVGVRAETQNDAVPLLQQVDLVLFLLERNAVRMERYRLDELQSNVNVISKELSSDHSIFKVSMAEEKSKARLMSWDCSSDGRIKIIAGAKKAPKTYYLMMNKIVNPEVCLEGCTMICFDCVVNRTKVDAQGMPDAKPEWNSTIDVVVPAGDDKVAIQLVFDGKIDAACGMFVQNGLFAGAMPVVGKLKREEALAQGVLVAQEVAVSRGADVVDSSSIVSAPSVFSTIKTTFFNSLHVIKNFFNVSWQKLVGCFKAS